ncbi:MAG: efflux RND transporter periplasmic adaptor subunit [Proteobacteria bacterium]|nr:efflux RND transporter periplasmic adaptor subunit [Pseudomonadota bacterium]
MSKGTRRFFKITVILAGILFLAVLAVRIVPAFLEGKEAGEGGQEFRTGLVARGTFEKTISSTGTLTAVGNVDVGTQVSGTVSKVFVDYNDKVSTGQVLAVLDQSSINAAVNVSEAAVQMREAEMEKAEAEYNRYRPLYEAGHLSEEEFFAYRTTLKTAAASLKQAEAELETNRINLGHTVIRSPIDGTVIERSVDAGQTVAASLSSPTLFIIAKDLSSMEIEASVDENDIGLISQGQKVNFTVLAFPEEMFHGTVSTIRLNPEVVSNVVNYTVIVNVDGTKDLLLPGMTATVDFIVSRIENALLVPSGALRISSRAGGGSLTEKTDPKLSKSGKVVFIVPVSGQIHPVPVTVLDDNDTVSAVEETIELREGSEVATGLVQGESSSTGQGNGGIASRLMPGPPGRRK